MDEKSFVDVIERLAESAPGSLNLESRLDEIGWDSLCMLGLISELDRKTGMTILPEGVVSSETVGDLFRAISSQ